MSFYTGTMAEALATLHWNSRMDGNDVEFVLAPPDRQQREDIMANILGEHTMWMFDFGLYRIFEKMRRVGGRMLGHTGVMIRFTLVRERGRGRTAGISNYN